MSITRMLVFLTVVSGLTAAIHYYLWARLVRDPTWPAPWSATATWALVLLGVSMPLSMMMVRLLPKDVLAPISWVVFTWMGVMFLLLVLLVPADLAKWATILADRFRDVGQADPGRREFLARLVGGGVAAGGLGLSAVALYSGLRPVDVKNVSVPTPRLSRAFDGFRVVQMTDIHVGPTIGRAFVEELVAKTNALEPDLIAITGDLVDGSVAQLGDAVGLLGQLRAKHGVFFVTGNHEYYSGADEWIAFLRSVGVRVLRNESVRIEREGASLLVAGVDDWTAAGFGGDHGPNLQKALADRRPDEPVLLLAHQPKQIVEAAARGVSLQISGHTHGGQIFPFNYLVKLQQPYVNGLHSHEGTQLYVSNGTGYWGPPMRLAMPAEITHLELRVA